MLNGVSMPTTYVTEISKLSTNDNLPGNRQIDYGNYGGGNGKVYEKSTNIQSYHKDYETE